MLGKTAGGIQFVVMIAVIDSPYRGRLDQGAQRIGAMARRQIDSNHIVRYVMTQAALVSSYRHSPHRSDMLLSGLLSRLNETLDYHVRLIQTLSDMTRVIRQRFS